MYRKCNWGDSAGTTDIIFSEGLNLENFSITQVLENLLDNNNKDFEINNDFAIVMYDFKIDSYYLIKNHFGTIPLYYINNEEYFAFASDINDLVELDKQSNILNLDKIYTFSRAVY